jgi:hypothetical protein
MSSEPATASIVAEVPRTPRFATVTVGRRRLPVWSILLIGYALSRVFSSGLLLLFFAASHDWSIAHFDGGSGFGGFLQSWDGLYYRIVATQGYPAQLPHDGSGDVAKNAWAFLPIYPLIVRGLMAITGLGFTVAAPLISAIAGGAATFALYRVVLGRFGQTSAIWGALLFSFGPMSYVLQIDYAESTYLFFMFAALAAMMSRRYLLMLPFGLVAAFSHPGAIALAAAIALQRLVGFIRREPASLRERLSAWIAVAVIGVAGIAWPFVVGFATGNATGYFETETAWWRDYIGQIHFFPLTPWFVFAAHYWGFLGILLIIAALVGFIFWFTRRSVLEYGTGLRAYTLSYVFYLVAVFLPQQSLIRMLLPLSPLLGHPALTRSRRRRVLSLTISAAFQPLCILLFWVVWPP